MVMVKWKKHLRLKMITSAEKVIKYLQYKHQRDTLPDVNDRTTQKWARFEYEELSFKIAMLKPTERDWQEYTLHLLKQ